MICCQLALCSYLLDEMREELGGEGGRGGKGFLCILLKGKA